jgi:hypothetical protein
MCETLKQQARDTSEQQRLNVKGITRIIPVVTVGNPAQDQDRGKSTGH